MGKTRMLHNRDLRLAQHLDVILYALKGKRRKGCASALVKFAVEFDLNSDSEKRSVVASWSCVRRVDRTQ